MNIEDKGIVSMELTEGQQLIIELQNIMINVNDYCEAVDEKTELFEVVVDLRIDLVKARDIAIHFYRTIEELREFFQKGTYKSPC